METGSLFGTVPLFMNFSNLNPLPLFYTAHNVRRLLFHGRDIYLRIFDLLPNGNGELKESALLRMPEDAVAIAAIRREPGGLRGLQPNVEIDQFLAQVPSSMNGSIRIYLEQGLGPQVFKNYFNSDITNEVRRTYAHPTTKGYNGLSFQWKTPEPNAWFESPSFILSGQNPPGLMTTVKKVSTVEHSGGRITCEQIVVNFLVIKTLHRLMRPS